MGVLSPVIDPAVSAHYVGDCRKLLKQLPEQCVQTCITSPPYWGLRDYGVDGQLGLEATPDEYVARNTGMLFKVRCMARRERSHSRRAARAGLLLKLDNERSLRYVRRPRRRNDASG